MSALGRVIETLSRELQLPFRGAPGPGSKLGIFGGWIKFRKCQARSHPPITIFISLDIISITYCILLYTYYYCYYYILLSSCSNSCGNEATPETKCRRSTPYRDLAKAETSLSRGDLVRPLNGSLIATVTGAFVHKILRLSPFLFHIDIYNII